MIGIDISSRSVKLVEVEGKSTLALRTVCWSPLPAELFRRGVIQDVLRVSQLVKQSLGKCSPILPAGTEVVASIPEVKSFLQVLDLPRMSKGEIGEGVKWAIRRHVPFDLDRVYLDWELLEAIDDGDGGYRVLVGLAQREVVDPLLAVLDRLGWRVLALELEVQALLRCLLPLNSSDNRDIQGVVIVDLGATTTNVVFFDRGSIRYTAGFQAGGDDLAQRLVAELGLSPDQAVEKKAEIGLFGSKKDPAVADILQAEMRVQIEKVVKIVQNVVGQMTAGQRLRTVLLSGGGANLTGVVDLYAEYFKEVTVKLGNPWTNLLPGGEKGSLHLPTNDAMHFTTALGSALRQADFTAN